MTTGATFYPNRTMEAVDEPGPSSAPLHQEMALGNDGRFGDLYPRLDESDNGADNSNDDVNARDCAPPGKRARTTGTGNADSATLEYINAVDQLERLTRIIMMSKTVGLSVQAAYSFRLPNGCLIPVLRPCRDQEYEVPSYLLEYSYGAFVGAHYGTSSFKVWSEWWTLRTAGMMDQRSKGGSTTCASGNYSSLETNENGNTSGDENEGSSRGPSRGAPNREGGRGRLLPSPRGGRGSAPRSGRGTNKGRGGSPKGKSKATAEENIKRRWLHGKSLEKWIPTCRRDYPFCARLPSPHEYLKFLLRYGTVGEWDKDTGCR